MTVLESSWKSVDGIDFYSRHWQVEKPKAAICLIHGLGEHCSRYDHFAKFFTEKGIVVFSFDHRGHGRSGGKRGHIPNYDTMLDDVQQLQRKTSQAYPGIPVFLYGHSMGGNLVLNYSLRRQPKVKGAIATGAHIRLAMPQPKLLIAAGRLLRPLLPGFSQPNGIDPNDISKDKSVVEKYINDPLVHNKVTSELGLSLLDAAQYLDDFSGNMPFPTLLVHGGEDGITSSEGSRAFSERVGGDISFQAWEGAFHEVHNEPDHQTFFEFVLNWINEILYK